MRSLRYGLVFGTIMLGYAAAATADTKTSYPTCSTVPTEADRKAAQGAFTAGQGSFNEADYATAIMYWRDAYRRDCTAHKLLLNLARAYEAKGDRAEAISALETYLSRKTDDPDAEQIQRRIQNLKAQLAPAPAATPAPTAQPAPAVSTTPTTTEPQPAAPQGPKTNLPPLLIAGGGAVLAIIGGIVYAGGQKKMSDSETLCPNRVCPSNPYSPTTPQYQLWNQQNAAPIAAAQSQGNDGRSQANAGGVVLVVGIAAVLGGGIWYLAAPTTPRKTTAGAHTLTLGGNTSIEPTIQRGFAGVSLGGSF